MLWKAGLCNPIVWEVTKGSSGLGFAEMWKPSTMSPKPVTSFSSRRLKAHCTWQFNYPLNPERHPPTPFLPSWGLQAMKCRRDHIVQDLQISKMPQAWENKNPWPFMIATVVSQQNTQYTIKPLKYLTKECICYTPPSKELAIMKAPSMKTWESHSFPVSERAWTERDGM